MHICHVITRLIVGGAQENTLLTCEGLHARGHRVTLISGPTRGPEGSLAPRARAGGYGFIDLPDLVRAVNPWRDVRARRYLGAELERLRPDVVHTHSSKAGIVGRWAARFAGVPVIVHTVHGWGFHDRQPAWLRWLYVVLERITAPLTDRLIVVAESDRDTGLRERIGTREKYTTIRSAIDVDFYATPRADVAALRMELGIPDGRRVICSVTRLSQQKDPLTLIRTAGQVCARRDDVHFLVVGDGPLRGVVEREVDRANLRERVTLAGLRRDVPDLLGCADIFLLTSLWEGLPRVFLQAMAAGLPIVATRTGGTEELLEDDATGVITEPKDVNALAGAILRLLDDPEEAERLRHAGKAKVAGGFAIGKMIGDLDQLYAELLFRRDRSSSDTTVCSSN
jgi:glycosyltransferase involved in cell wall biosynthesis